MCSSEMPSLEQFSLRSTKLVQHGVASTINLTSLLQGAVTYRLPTNAMSWSSVFRQLESNKERLGIVDYSVSQTTLEQVQATLLSNMMHSSFLIVTQVFINFAKEQFEE